jgi:hypothetical protein
MDYEDRKENLKQAIREQFRRDLPLMDVERLKAEFIDWLAQVRFPEYPGKRSWEEVIEAFPPQAGEEQESDGRRLRLALRLYTSTNRYLIAVTESLNSKNRGVYTLSAHVNWQDTELRLQKVVDETYLGEFDAGLRTKHTLWAQPIRYGDVYDALSYSAAAILAHELRGVPSTSLETRAVVKPAPVAPHFPSPVSD